MFDLLHSDVFECSKYYAQMKGGLMNDFFFSSIVKKSEYYYNRSLVESRFIIDSNEYPDILLLNEKQKKEKSLEHKIDNINVSIKKCEKKLPPPNERNPICPSIREQWYSILVKKKNNLEDKLTTIQTHISTFKSNKPNLKSTLDSLLSLYAEKLDESEAEWIDVIMSPLADKHFSFSPKWYEDLIPRKKKNQFSVSESWFVNPEEEMSRVVFPLKDDNKKIHYLNSFELGSLIGIGDLSSVLQRNTKVSRWFFRRFDFVDTYRIHLFKHWNHFFAPLLLVFCIVTMMPRFWSCPRNIALFPAAIAFGSLIFIVFSLIWGHKGNKIIDDVLVKKRLRRERFNAIRFSLLFTTIWAFLFFYDYNVIVKGIILLGITVLLLFFIKPKVNIINNIHIFLPRLVASITAAWIPVVIGNDLVKEHLSWPICAIISIIVFAFILYESNKTLPNISNWPRVWRALELMLISFSLSVIIGIFAIDILSPSLIHDANKNNLILHSFSWPFPAINKEFIITIFPDYLIEFSFLAMFIGVFIQMIFEEKNITEI